VRHIIERPLRNRRFITVFVFCKLDLIIYSVSTKRSDLIRVLRGKRAKARLESRGELRTRVSFNLLRLF
jgi:hypothetical protein